MNKAVKIAMEILAGYHYIWDPNHNDKPAGNWKMTKSGWSTYDDVDETAEKSTRRTTTTTTEEDKDIDIDVNEETTQAVPQTTDTETTVEQGTGGNGELITDDTGGDGFVTDEEGKKEELETEGGTDTQEGEEDWFDDAHKADYLNPDKYDEYIEKMNAFIQQFDEGEGKENEVTFKAVASNLNWSSMDEVKIFDEHCVKKGLNNAGEILGFLFYQHQSNEERFDKIIGDMP